MRPDQVYLGLPSNSLRIALILRAQLEKSRHRNRKKLGFPWIFANSCWTRPCSILSPFALGPTSQGRWL